MRAKGRVEGVLAQAPLIGWWLNEAAKSPRLECPLQHQPGSVFVSRFEVEIEAFVVLRKTRELRMSSSQIGADDACFDFKTRGWARPTAVALWRTRNVDPFLPPRGTRGPKYERVYPVLQVVDSLVCRSAVLRLLKLFLSDCNYSLSSDLRQQASHKMD